MTDRKISPIMFLVALITGLLFYGASAELEQFNYERAELCVDGDGAMNLAGIECLHKGNDAPYWVKNLVFLSAMIFMWSMLIGLFMFALGE